MLSALPCALQEVEYFEKMEVRDFHNDILLAEACRTDVEQHCKKAKRGASPPQRDTIRGLFLDSSC